MSEEERGKLIEIAGSIKKRIEAIEEQEESNTYKEDVEPITIEEEEVHDEGALAEAAYDDYADEAEHELAERDLEEEMGTMTAEQAVDVLRNVDNA